MLEHFIAQLSKELDISFVREKNQHDYYSLSINPETLLLFKDLNPGFTCRSDIAELPKEGDLETMYLSAMSANFLGQGTKGAAIAIDETVKHFLFTLSLKEEITYPTFKDIIEDFVNYLYYWRSKLK